MEEKGRVILALVFRGSHLWVLGTIVLACVEAEHQGEKELGGKSWSPPTGHKAKREKGKAKDPFEGHIPGDLASCLWAPAPEGCMTSCHRLVMRPLRCETAVDI